MISDILKSNLEGVRKRELTSVSKKFIFLKKNLFYFIF
jgi:hypothetical protein